MRVPMTPAFGPAFPFGSNAARGNDGGRVDAPPSGLSIKPT
jgi:hypothetical protein